MMASTVVHISEVEAARDLPGLLNQVAAGAEIIIERDHQPLAVVRPPDMIHRKISESIALAELHEKETDEPPVLDPDFAADVEEIIRLRQPWKPANWE
jgi:antitoxin (DNA-binding transcriptional repressor) of toxin-antitoxin stability system